MTFLDTDVIRVLEEVLPARFGGGPTDFQILEEESEGGEPVLKLLVRPSLGPLNESDVIETFIGGANRIMGLAWKSGDLLRVERREPLSTRSGKILHMHVKPPGNV